jgi:cell wall-associated NlpC family hydrolase
MSWVLKGPAQQFEPREWFSGPDMVELGLAGEIGSVRYVEPRALVCTAPRLTLHKGPDAAAEAVSELLFGEGFEIVDVKAGFALGRCLHDRYIGWAAFDALALPGALPGAVPSAEPAHRITARRAPVFAAASIKAAVHHELPFAARVAGEMAGDFLTLHGGGFVHRRHVELAPTTRFAAAALFADAPYLWGGRSPDGVDCSGLVQQALAAEGITLRRDTDLQRQDGEPAAFGARQAGDLLFFPGHVGLLLDDDRLCHANAYWMRVVTEPLADVIARLPDAPEPAVRRFK